MLLVYNNVSEIVGSFCLMKKRETRLAFSRVPPEHGSIGGCREKPGGPRI